MQSVTHRRSLLDAGVARLLPLASAAALMCSSSARAAESAPAEAPWQIAFQSRLSVERSNCPIRFTQQKNFLAYLGFDGKKTYYLLPGAQPEHAIVSPIFHDDGRLPDFEAASQTSFPAESVGSLNFTKTLKLRFAADNTAYSGTLTFVNVPKVNAEVAPEHVADAELLGKSACTLTARLSGHRTDAPPVDSALEVKVWELLKAHTDHVTRMDPVASMPPLLAGLELGDKYRVEFLWRLSRAYFLKGEQLPQADKDGRLAAFQQAIDYARQGVELNPEHGEAAFFLAAGTGRYNTTKGFLKTVIGLEKFEQLCLKAIENGSEYNLFGFTVIGDAHHALGQFYRLVPDSGLIKMLLGTRGDIDKSIQHHRLSVEQQPDRGDYLKELGVSLLCKYDKNRDETLRDEATRLFAEAAKTATWAFDNPQLDKDHMRRLLLDAGDACAYSRDNYR